MPYKNKTETLDLESFRRTRRMILSRVLLAPFVTVMLVCGTLVYYFAANLRHDVSAQLSSIAEGHQHLIEQFLVNRTADLEFAANAFTFEEINGPGKLDKVLSQLQQSSPAFFDLGVFDNTGRHVAYSGPFDLQGKRYDQTEWFKAVQTRGIYVSDVFLGYRNIPHFVIAVRKNEQGRTWYLRATIDTITFNKLVEDIRIGKTGEAYLINREGVFQTRRRSGGNLMEIDPDQRAYRINQHSNITSFIAEDANGQDHIYADGQLHPTGWLLVVRQETSEAYAPLVRAVLIAVALIVGGGAVVVVMAYILASGLSNSLIVSAIEKRQMGSQLIMAGKLAEVGEMSSGVAHEINNPLQVMKSEYTMINDVLIDFETGQKPLTVGNLELIRDSVEQIGHQIDRCKKITQGLLKFARKSDTTLAQVSVQPLISEVVNMIEHRAELQGVRIVQKYDPDLPYVLTDSNQLQQVFLNLLNNALYALKERDSGEIRISAERDNNDIAIALADNGCGIPPDCLEKIFLPFFTTKPVGQGTGLGLSTSYGIVERLGGRIFVASEVNAGTVFTIRLPLAAPQNPESGFTYQHHEGGIRT